MQMDCEDDVQWLRAQLRAAQQRAELAEHDAEHAKHAAAHALPQNLAGFLLSCHKLYCLIRAVTMRSAATTGDTTNPTNRWYPECIIPWQDFHHRQQEEWRLLNLSEALWTQTVYPSVTVLDYLGRTLDPIGSEHDLRYIERATLENMVKKMFESISFGREQAFDGEISFENQARFVSDGAQDPARGASASAGERYARNIRADQFCDLRRKGEFVRPIVAVEYKAPHKLTVEEISTGLRGAIWPERDVIDKFDEAFDFRCKNLMAAVITQLFSYMIDRGVQYGYICTGEALIFGYIPDDPTSFQYSVNIPRTDFDLDVQNHLERTAVAQVFAFTLQALRAGEPGADWSDRARAKLKRWKVEFFDVLATIPITERKSREASAYEPSIWLTSSRQRRRYSLRGSCNDQDHDGHHESSGEDGDGNDYLGDFDSPSKPIASRTRQAAVQRNRANQSLDRNTDHHRGSTTSNSRISIEDRSYCSHRCLLGLRKGHPVDPDCPNAADHGAHHISRELLLRLLTKQIEVDRGRDADCIPLYLYGAHGALFKIRLTAHGYTMVAKGMESTLRSFFLREHQAYQQLEPLQGLDIPVCCGWLRSKKPYFFDGVPLEYFLVTSFAGRSRMALEQAGAISEELRQRLDREEKLRYQRIRALGVEHGDKASRNSVYDIVTNTAMTIDFDRSTLVKSMPLSALSPNRKRKRQGTAPLRQGKLESHGIQEFQKVCNG